MGRLLALAGLALCLLMLYRLPLAPAEQEPAPAAEAAASTTTDDAAAESNDGMLDPLGPNAACYVCHMTFVDEELALTHLAVDITCADCHGASEGHANDEDIGATPPDIVIKGPAINQSCRNCHKRHDVAPEEVIARWLARQKQAQAQAKPKSPPAPAKAPAKAAKPAAKRQPPVIVCTDCHGQHRVAKAL
jgi:hypothetical protein